MRRIQVIAATDSYDPHTGRLVHYVATQYRGQVEAMINWLGRAPTALGLGKAYKKRTTGKKSQNHHYWGHLHQLVTESTAQTCGTDIDLLDYAIRYRAISWGWKFNIVAGQKVPYAESEGSSIEYGKLIECVHHFAAEIGFILYEGEEDDERELRAFLGEG